MIRGTRIDAHPCSVTIVCPVVAHYRAGAFRELARSDVQFQVLAAKARPERALATIDPTELDLPFRLVKETRFKGLRWQHGIVREAVRTTDAAWVMTGDWAFLSTWIAAALLRLRRRTVLFWTHGWVRPDHGLRRSIRKRFYRLANGLLLYGERAVDLARESGLKGVELFVVFNSLDSERIEQARGKVTKDEIEGIRALFSQPSRRLVIFTGRLTAAKDLGCLLRAARELESTPRAVNVLLVGDGPERARLESLMHSIGLDGSVHFYGASHDESFLAAAFAAAEVCVLPGKTGLTAVHSQLYGVPVLTHGDLSMHAPEVESIQPGVSGELISPFGISELAAAIARWTDGSLDEERRKAIREFVARRYHPRVQRQVIEEALYRLRAFGNDTAAGPRSWQ